MIIAKTPDRGSRRNKQAAEIAFNNMIKEWNGKVIATGQQKELQDRRFYTKPTVERNLKKQKAIYRNKWQRAHSEI